MAGKRLVGVVSGDGSGDLPPVLALVEGLLARNHSITMVCEENSRSQFDRLGIETIIIPEDSELRNVWTPEVRAEQRRMLSSGEGLDGAENIYATVADRAVSAILVSVKQAKPDLLFSSLFAPVLTDRLASAVDASWAYINPAFVDREGNPRSLEDDFISPVSIHLREKWFTDSVHRAALVIYATDSEFDPITSDFPGNHHQVGPLNLVSQQPPPDYILEDGPPWVLVSVSLSPQAGELAIVEHALEALRTRDVRVLVTAPMRADELQDVPANALIVDRAPHDAVLERSILAISHAGHGLVMKSLIHGVPMVLVPWDRDQTGSAYRSRQLGTAEIIPRKELSRDSMAEAIDRVFSTDSFQIKSTAVARRIAEEHSVELACDLLESTMA